MCECCVRGHARTQLPREWRPQIWNTIAAASKSPFGLSENAAELSSVCDGRCFRRCADFSVIAMYFDACVNPNERELCAAWHTSPAYSQQAFGTFSRLQEILSTGESP
jgi:hypothetical protein